MTLITRTTFAMGLMLSPMFLAIFGNTLGEMGSIFVVFVVMAAVFQVFNARLYCQALQLEPRTGSEAVLIGSAMGPMAGFVFPMCARLVVATSLTASLLSTSGFVFNEVFVYWFPNFGFAFLLLAALLAINLAGRKVAGRFQVGFVAMAVTGLLILSFWGFSTSGRAPLHAPSWDNLQGLRAVFIALILFTGVDFSHLSSPPSNTQPPTTAMVSAIAAAAGVFCLWGTATLFNTSPENLAGTTVPYMTSARRIMGQEGRLIMGGVLLAGTCAAVNAIFISSGRLLTLMVDRGFPPDKRVNRHGHWGTARFLPVLLLAASTALLMLAGAAGSPLLEIFVHAGLVFWILNFAAVHFSAWLLEKRHLRSSLEIHSGASLSHLFFAAVLVFGCLVLIGTDSRSKMLLLSMAATLASMGVLAFLRDRVSRIINRLSDSGGGRPQIIEKRRLI